MKYIPLPETVNRENFQRIADLMLTIDSRMFSMEEFRNVHSTNPVCESVGCAIGHATCLDAKNVTEKYLVESFFRPSEIKVIGYHDWSYDFLGLGELSALDDSVWLWCFSQSSVDVDNTPLGVASRINVLLEKGLPENWAKQLEGIEPLCYK